MKPSAGRELPPLVRACLLLCALAFLVPAGVANPGPEREPLFDGRLRPGWAVQAEGGLDAAAGGGVLEARPNDATRPYARVLLSAAPDRTLDARPSAYLTFEINTLAGASGAHRVPVLRIGVSDTTGRSRLPLLSRYTQVDTDPASWQQVVIPLADVLDRGVRADAIGRVSWQFTGSPAAFAVRRVAFLARGEPTATNAASGINLVPDPSFETRTDARPVSAGVGDLRDEAGPGERSILAGNAAQGRRFLRLRGPHAFFFEALAPRANAVGFSIALRAPQPGPVEIGCEMVAFGLRGGMFVAGRAVRRVEVDAGWRRSALSAALQPQELPAEEGELRLYRAWVRPLTAGGPLDVDAVCLAPAPVDAATFTDARANTLEDRSGVFRQVRALMDYRPHAADRDHGTPPGLQADLPPLKVPLEVREWAGRRWPAGTLVSGGIPLARGTVYSPDALRVRGPDGKDVPFQFDVLRRDLRDGSVRCLWLTFPAAPGPGERLAYTLESGADTAAVTAPIATESGSAVLLDTGAFRMRLPRDRFPLFADAEWPDTILAGTRGAVRLQLLDGRELTSAGPPQRVTIERNGPLAAVVCVAGTLTPADDRPGPQFTYEARLRAWKGLPGIQVDLAVTNLTPAQSVPVHSLALVVPTARVRRVDAALGQENGAPVTAPLRWMTDFLRLTQRRDPFGAGREETLVEGSERPPAAGPGRAAGWARWQPGGRTPVYLVCREMARRHPSALEVGAESLTGYLVPPSGVKALDFPLGLSAYGEFWVGAGETPELMRDRLEHPPLLAATPAHAAASGVFGRFASAETVAAHYPFLSALQHREARLRLGDADRVGATGWLNDGDTGTFGLWRHGDGDSLEGLTLAYLQGGDPAFWEGARRQALHLREVATWWGNEESAFVHAGGGLHTSYALDGASFHLTGLLYDYWLNGDQRSLEVADALGAEILALAGTLRYGGGEGAHLMGELAELYAATGRHIYRQAYERALSQGAPGGIDTGAGSLAVSALGGGQEESDDPLLVPRFRQRLDQLGDWLQRHRPPTALGSPGDASLPAALAYAPREALAGPAWESALEYLHWLLLAPYTRDAALLRAPQALANLGEPFPAAPAWAAGSPLGIAAFSGGTRTFAIRIHRTGSEPVRLTLCRMRAQTPELTRGYRVRYELRDPLGRPVRSATLAGDTFQAYPLSLPGLGITGDYLLLLRCEEDGLVELLSTHPRVALRADEWKAARIPQARARFFLRAPKGGEVRILLHGAASASADSAFAAALSAPDGKSLGIARWAVPTAGTGPDGALSPRTFPTEPLRLVVPAPYRGQILCLEVTAPRAVEWRVDGLDEPWLGAAPAAFGP